MILLAMKEVAGNRERQTLNTEEKIGREDGVT